MMVQNLYQKLIKISIPLWVPLLFLIQYTAIIRSLIFVRDEYMSNYSISVLSIRTLSFIVAIFPTIFIIKRVISEIDQKEQLLSLLESFGITSLESPKYLTQDKKEILSKSYESYMQSNQFNEGIDVEFEISLGETARLTGRYIAAIKHYDLAIKTSLQIRDNWNAARAKMLKSFTKHQKLEVKLFSGIQYEVEELQDVIDSYADSYEFAKEFENLPASIDALNGLGTVWLVLGESEKSEFYQTTALELAESISDSRCMVDSMLCLANTYTITNPELVEPLVNQAIGISRSSNYNLGLAYSFSLLGSYYLLNNLFDDAKKYLELSIMLFEENGAYVHSKVNREILEKLET